MKPTLETLARRYVEARDEVARMRELLGRPWNDELLVSGRTYHRLEAIGVKTLGDVCDLTESDLLRGRNFGRKSLNEVKAELAKMGLKLREVGR